MQLKEFGNDFVENMASKSIGTSRVEEVFNASKAIAKCSKIFTYSSKSSSESVLLRLHCTVTMFILSCSFIVISSKLFTSEPITCLSSKNTELPPALIQQYCWLDGIFTVVSKDEDINIAYHGVKPIGQNDKIVYHRYYQWVMFVLIVQCVLFYIPRYLWRLTIQSKIQDAVAVLNSSMSNLGNTETKLIAIKSAANVCMRGNHYLLWYIICDLCCLVNLLCHIWFTNVFLRGEFLNVGRYWYGYAYYGQRNDALSMTFPRFAKCSFTNYGYGGERVIQDALCFLPLNVVNEKIYSTLWLWFAFLLVITPLIILWRVLYILPSVRKFLLRYASPFLYSHTITLISRNPGIWFVSYKICSIIKPLDARAIFPDIADFIAYKMKTACTSQEPDVNASTLFGEKQKYDLSLKEYKPIYPNPVIVEN